MNAVHSPLQARIVQWAVAPGDVVAAGDLLLILEAMKMEHEVRASVAGQVTELFFAADELVESGALLATLQAGTASAVARAPSPSAQVASTALRPDLQRVLDRNHKTADASRPEAMAKRHALGLRSARENIADLCDEGSFIEYGALAVAAQRSRRSEEDLMANTPADGMV
ncbi:MAG: biotin/lipoyl-binding protein, partial [Pseudomonadota bacterium]|nr:biotin/lipoyl-binding protein [Pseudomonadota bacterium]